MGDRRRESSFFNWRKLERSGEGDTQKPPPKPLTLVGHKIKDYAPVTVGGDNGGRCGGWDNPATVVSTTADGRAEIKSRNKKKGRPPGLKPALRRAEVTAFPACSSEPTHRLWPPWSCLSLLWSKDRL
jgi:hypothetical protein